MYRKIDSCLLFAKKKNSIILVKRKAFEAIKKTLLHINDPQNHQNTTTKQAKKNHGKWSIFRGGRRSYFMSTVPKVSFFTKDFKMDFEFDVKSLFFLFFSQFSRKSSINGGEAAGRAERG